MYIFPDRIGRAQLPFRCFSRSRINHWMVFFYHRFAGPFRDCRGAPFRSTLTDGSGQAGDHAGR